MCVIYIEGNKEGDRERERERDSFATGRNCIDDIISFQGEIEQLLIIPDAQSASQQCSPHNSVKIARKKYEQVCN